MPCMAIVLSRVLAFADAVLLFTEAIQPLMGALLMCMYGARAQGLQTRHRNHRLAVPAMRYAQSPVLEFPGLRSRYAMSGTRIRCPATRAEFFCDTFAMQRPVRT
eukprot:2744808-Rhodomonas_salina.1